MIDPETATTELLEAHAQGEAEAFDRLLGRVYGDFRRLARLRLRDRPPQTLDSGALVHETYLRLASANRGRWQSGGHFRAAFGQAMRHVLVDAARRRLAARRGGGRRGETLGEGVLAEERHAERLLAVDQALGRLRRLDQRLARVVECRFFAGMTEGETAECLGVSSRTVHRDWLRARGWLRLHLGRRDGAPASGVTASGAPASGMTPSGMTASGMTASGMTER